MWAILISSNLQDLNSNILMRSYHDTLISTYPQHWLEPVEHGQEEEQAGAGGVGGGQAPAAAEELGQSLLQLMAAQVTITFMILIMIMMIVVITKIVMRSMDQ